MHGKSIPASQVGLLPVLRKVTIFGSASNDEMSKVLGVQVDTTIADKKLEVCSYLPQHREI